MDWSEWASVNVSCAQQVTVSDKIQNDIQAAINQAAKSISQSLNLNPGSTKSKNMTNLTTELSTAITNNFIQNCASQLGQQQSLTITDVT
jgi:hypothetical protein